jgi:CRISPR-associated protein Csb1
MANRLEAVCMKAPGVWVDDLAGLPLIAVNDPAARLLATNLTEPHRIASSYVLEGKLPGGTDLKQEMEKYIEILNNRWALDKRPRLDRWVFALDPSALLHGFQFVQWKFVGLRQTRLLHARIEAELPDDPEVYYGMVKWDAIEPDLTSQKFANKGQSIAAKSRIVPKDIIATFELDLGSLKALALPEDQKKFLLGLALWKIGAFLGNRCAFDARSRQSHPSLHLRADCYLSLVGGQVQVQAEGSGMLKSSYSPNDLMGSLPDKPDFRPLIRELGIEPEDALQDAYRGPVVVVTYEPSRKERRQEAEEEEEAEGDE